MSADVRALPTFCHISELGAFGYQNLHRMVAASSPLYLWAPSSVLLKSPSCTVPPAEFLRYLEEGHIRIIARHPWLTDRRFREQHLWDGARWDPDVDGVIRSIYEEDDAERDVGKRRVMAAGDATGWERAEQYLEEDPGSLQRWIRVLNGAVAEEAIPPGTLQAARREAATDQRRAVLLLLSTAHNHGQAMRDADAQVPFLLRAEDPRFLSLIARMYSPGNQSAPRRVVKRQRRVQEEFAALTQRLVTTLERIETDRTRLDKFVGTQGHRDLVAWVGNICERVKNDEAGTVNLEVRTALLDELRRGRFHETRAVEFRRLSKSLETPQLIADLGLALTGYLEHEHLGIASLAVSGFAVAHAVSRSMGLVPGDFTGEQWPFLYASGREATPKRLRNLEERLE
jgi:hypothetical protein